MMMKCLLGSVLLVACRATNSPPPGVPAKFRINISGNTTKLTPGGKATVLSHFCTGLHKNDVVTVVKIKGNKVFVQDSDEPIAKTDLKPLTVKDWPYDAEFTWEKEMPPGGSGYFEEGAPVEIKNEKTSTWEDWGNKNPKFMRYPTVGQNKVCIRYTTSFLAAEHIREEVGRDDIYEAAEIKEPIENVRPKLQLHQKTHLYATSTSPVRYIRVTGKIFTDHFVIQLGKEGVWAPRYKLNKKDGSISITRTKPKNCRRHHALGRNKYKTCLHCRCDGISWEGHQARLSYRSYKNYTRYRTVDIIEDTCKPDEFDREWVTYRYKTNSGIEYTPNVEKKHMELILPEKIHITQCVMPKKLLNKRATPIVKKGWFRKCWPWGK